MSYYIGVDGGGTKTQYALFDEKKNMLASVKTEGTNHENLAGGIPEAAGILMRGIEELLLNNALMQKEITFVLMALAGMDHPYQEEAMAKALKKAGLKIPFSVYNDGFIVVKAGVSGKAGIGYNCGTGTCCNSIDDRGNLLQIGGFGMLSGDVGGGLWIVAQTFQLVYNEICLGGAPALGTRKMCEKFGMAPERGSLLAMIPYYEKEDRSFIRDMIDVFFESLAEGDAETAKVSDYMARRGAEFIAGHIRKQHFAGDVIEVILSGSMHTKLVSDAYIAQMKAYTEELTGRKCEFKRLTVPPVTGAINWMLE
jgi:N-acetylglucosamine kinase-like BadF-type ATPase